MLIGIGVKFSVMLIIEMENVKPYAHSVEVIDKVTIAEFQCKVTVFTYYLWKCLIDLSIWVCFLSNRLKPQGYLSNTFFINHWNEVHKCYKLTKPCGRPLHT